MPVYGDTRPPPPGLETAVDEGPVAYMGGPSVLVPDRPAVENPRLVVTAVGTADGSGNLSVVFDPVSLGAAWWGSVSVPGAPAGSSLVLFLNNRRVATITASNPWGPFVVLGGERLTLTGTGLTVGAQYEALFLGIMRDVQDVTDLVTAVVPQTVAVSGTIPVTIPTPVPVTQSGAWNVGLNASTSAIGTVGTTTTTAPTTGQTKWTSGAAVQLQAGSVVPTNGIVVQALSANAASVWVGASGVTSSTGFELQPGQSVTFTCNVNAIYVLGTSANDGVCWNVE